MNRLKIEFGLVDFRRTKKKAAAGGKEEAAATRRRSYHMIYVRGVRGGGAVRLKNCSWPGLEG